MNKSPSPDKQLDALKVMPHSVEAEQAVLGGLMLDNNAWETVSEILIEEDFYRIEHRVIFRAFSALSNRDAPFDVLTLSDSLKQQNQLSDVKGEAYLFELAKNTPSAANILAYADIVRERSVLRQLVTAANEIASNAFRTEGRTAQELLDYAEQTVFKISEQGGEAQGGGPQNINTVMAHALDNIQTRFDAKGALLGLSTGFKDLDAKTSGLQEGELVIVAARPSMGKTTFAMNIAESAALDLARNNNNKAVLVFSMEMPAEQLVMRMIASLGRIELQRLRTGRLRDEDWPRITSTVSMFSQSKLLIDDSAGLTPSEVRARARRVAREYGGVALIVIDYLQLMQVPGYTNNRVAEVSEISRSLKALAKELKVPVIALSQLNRSLETRPDKRPVMSDIRESGSIEQDADLILFIYRDEVYNENTQDKNIAEVIIGKQRNGPIGKSRLRFDGHFTKFDNLDEYHYTGGEEH
jgi:replicative DNA helicase